MILPVSQVHKLQSINAFSAMLTPATIMFQAVLPSLTMDPASQIQGTDSRTANMLASGSGSPTKPMVFSGIMSSAVMHDAM